MTLGKDPRKTPQIRKAHAAARTRLLASVKAMQDAGMGEMRCTAVVEAIDSGSASRPSQRNRAGLPPSPIC
jgi:hypothetical protein